MTLTSKQLHTLGRVGTGLRSVVTCLLVEDDHYLRDLVATYLEDHGVRVVGASRPRELGPLIASNQPDLIVLDLGFGEERDFDLLRELRAQSTIPVIITTGCL